MKKLLILPLLVVIACLLAGVYGVLHDQFTYSISKEYYTKFKFRQFGLLHSPLPARAMVSIVGFGATWWMGLIIGLLVGAVGFIHSGPRRMLIISLRSLVLVIAVSLLVGLAGLAYGFFRTTTFDLASYRGWFIPPGLEEPRRFLLVGYMHNASYLGGALSIVVAWIYHFRVRRQDRLRGGD